MIDQALIRVDAKGRIVMRLDQDHPEYKLYYEAAAESSPDQEDGEALAQWYADMLNAILETSGKSAEDVFTESFIEQLDSELAETDWTLSFDEDQGSFEVIHADEHSPKQYAAIHAPRGGLVINGRYYRGGRWIPAGVMMQASPDDLAKLAAKAPAAALSSDKIDLAKVLDEIKKFRESAKAEDPRFLKKINGTLTDIYGDQTAQRLGHLGQTMTTAYNGAGGPGKKKIGKSLGVIAALLDMQPSRQEGETSGSPKSDKPIAAPQVSGVSGTSGGIVITVSEMKGGITASSGESLERGATKEEAVGNLVILHGPALGITVEDK